MPAYRYFIDCIPKAQETTELSGGENDHLQKVMRGSIGQTVELVDGSGLIATAEITESGRKKSSLKICEIQRHTLTHQLSIIQALPQMSHLEILIEKGCELGMTKLVLFPQKNKDRPLSEAKKLRLRAKLIAAMKQSGRVFLPQIVWIDTLDEINFPDTGIFLGSLDPKAPLFLSELKKKQPLPKELWFACGAEEGFSPKIEKRLIDLGFQKTRLHSNILRTETAPLSFLSLAHHYLMAQVNSAVVN